MKNKKKIIQIKYKEEPVVTNGKRVPPLFWPPSERGFREEWVNNIKEDADTEFVYRWKLHGSLEEDEKEI